MEPNEEEEMKKINIFFILECMIIILLLAILGVLLKNNGKSKAQETVIEETMVEETVESEEAAEEFVVEEESTNVSGIVNVTDIIMNSEGEESQQTIVSSQNSGTDTVSENSISENSVSENQTDIAIADNAGTTKKTLAEKKIVVFADSIWNDGRGVDGISEHIQEKTGATVYNCAVGGSTAALVGETNDINKWTSSSFNGMVYIARGLVSRSQVLSGREAYDVIKQVNLEETDYVIVAYGLNDFFSGVSIYPEEYFQITNYVGALRNGIANLTVYYPNLEVIVVSPTYTKLFEGEKEFEIGDYVEAARGVAKEFDVHFLDMFHTLGSDAESRTEHLEDGVHLSADGREIYANAVISFLKKLENTEE